MQTEQLQLTAPDAWKPTAPGALGATADLVVLFGARHWLNDAGAVAAVRRAYPKAMLIGCSTAGEIRDTEVSDDSLVVTAVDFEHTVLRGAMIEIDGAADSFAAGKRLAAALPHAGLTHVFVLSAGLNVNGSELVTGLTQHLPAGITATGGLAGDADRFQETTVLFNETASAHAAVVVGFYGERLQVGYGSLGGWDSFGPERLVTRAEANVLYELDGHSALDLYKQYLGEHAAGLPATGLLFPLSIRTPKGETAVVRTILGIDEQQQTMTFAGDIPTGSYARLMKANFDRLIDGAVGAARTSYAAIGKTRAELAILISCVGRKMVLKQRTEEEVEGVRDILGPDAALTGFYSYGEISPFTPQAKCELHNQTMTITTFSER